jgi:hypothetical protein
MRWVVALPLAPRVVTVVVTAAADQVNDVDLGRRRRRPLAPARMG